jgi:hypothetical protein
LPRAASLAAEISEAYGVTPKLREGHNGIFTVEINGDVVFNNRQAGTRFPTDEEILKHVGKYKAGA